jgi:predicted DNA-binding transcriptional regulator YafY
MNRTDRLHALSESLRRAGRRGRTAAQLATEFEVTTRTIKRDLVALQSAGLPLWGRPGPGGGYGLAESATRPPVIFSTAQAVALCAAVAAAAQAPFADSATAATRKVLDALDPGARRQAVELAQRVWVDVGPPAPRRVLTAVEHGLTNQLTVNLTYLDRRGAVTRREVEPMIIALTRGRWWLVGWCRLRDDIRWFELARVQTAASTRRRCSGRTTADIGTPPESARPATA